MSAPAPYRGRLAPTPSGLLHLGHAQTFRLAQERAQRAGGTLILRVEDLDQARCRPEYVSALYEDLRWAGLRWQEGPDVGGPHAPYVQSQRQAQYLEVWRALLATGCLYPSPHSRADVERALSAPHEGDFEPVFPPELRPPVGTGRDAREPGAMNWRFRVPDGETLRFTDGRVGPCSYVAGEDFGDFIVWRRDGFPSYDLAVVADDHAMQVTEVVRGEDLLAATARQMLLYQALGWAAPAWYHAPLVRDAAGQRLAKRAGSLTLRALRESGRLPEELGSGTLL